MRHFLSILQTNCMIPVNKPEFMTVCDEVEDTFGYAEVQVVSSAELYGGKICAALDR